MAVHAACEYDDQGDLNESTVHEIVIPYLEGWRRFKRETDVRFTEIEKRAEHPLYRGTPDRIGFINDEEGVFDIKSGNSFPWHGIQLAAYANMFARTLKRWSVVLPGNGRYKLTEYKDRSDFKVWSAVLTVATWREAHGMNEEAA